LAKVVADVEAPIVLLGDLNTTPWSPIYRQFIEDSGLRDARDGFGLLSSWPTGNPPLLIPIDHALVSQQIVVHNLYLGPDVGSDHYPLILDFSVRPGNVSAIN
jgi:endonuclease/exonuclease/phosphatase (EEP) superfamily protein YafD